MIFPFIYGDGSQLVFNWNTKELFVKFRNYKKVISLEGFKIPNFYYGAGSLYYRGEDIGIVEFQRENVVISFMVAKNPRRSEKAQILYKDFENLESWGFPLNTLRLKAFLDMLASLDKIVAVSRKPHKEPIFFAEKRKGEIYLENFKVPYTAVSIIFENLKDYILTGKAYNITQNLEGGYCRFHNNILEVGNNERTFLKKILLSNEVALKLMSAINLYGIGGCK
jgi:hypothetical protein